MDPEEKKIRNELGELSRQGRVLDDRILVAKINKMLMNMIVEVLDKPDVIDTASWARKIVAHVREHTT